MGGGRSATAVPPVRRPPSRRVARAASTCGTAVPRNGRAPGAGQAPLRRAGLAMRGRDRLAVRRPALAKPDAEEPHRRHAEELALPVLEGLEPELRPQHVL